MHTDRSNLHACRSCHAHPNPKASSWGVLHAHACMSDSSRALQAVYLSLCCFQACLVPSLAHCDFAAQLMDALNDVWRHSASWKQHAICFEGGSALQVVASPSPCLPNPSAQRSSFVIRQSMQICNQWCTNDKHPTSCLQMYRFGLT